MTPSPTPSEAGASPLNPGGPRRRWPARLLKAALAALLAAAILLLGGLSILLLTFDPNQYKAVLIQVVQEREHRTLTLPGTIELKLFPPLTLRTGPFTLSERDSTALFARADDLRLHLDLFALLRRKLVVDRVVMVRPQIHVVRNAQGVFNFADLLPDAQSTADTPRSPLGLSVHRLQVEQGALLLDDDKAQVHGQLDAVELALSGLDGGHVGNFHGAGMARFVQPALAMHVAWRGKLQVDAPQHGVALSDLALSLQGDALGCKAVQAQLAAVGLNLRTGPELALEARQWSLKAAARLPSAQTLQLQATLPTLDLHGTTLQVGPLHASADVTSAQPVQVDLRTQQGAGTLRELRLPVAQLDLHRGRAGKPGAAQLTAASPLQLDLTQGRASLAALKLSGQIQTATAAQTLALQGTAEAAAGSAKSPATAQLQLQGLLAGRALTTTAAWTAPNALKLGLDADSLDLDAWLPAATPPAASATKPATAGATAIDLSPLQGLTLDAQVKLGSLVVRGTQWHAVQGQVYGDGNTLALQSFSAQGFGGTVDGNLQVDLASQRYSLQQTGRDLSVQPVLRALTGHDALLGKASWTLDVNAQGKTLQALLASLSGKARLDVKNGALKGFNLAQMLRNARTLLAARKDGQFGPTPGEQTDFTALGASVTLRDGVAHNTDLTLQTPLLRVGGEGWFDLPRQHMDYLLFPTLVGTLQGQGGAEMAALRGVTVPVQLHGSFAQPAYTVLWSKAGGSLVRQTLQNSLQHALRQQLAPTGTRPQQPAVPGLFKGLFP